MSCPILESVWQRYSALIYLILAIVAMVLFVYGCLVVVAYTIGGTITGGMFRMSRLAMWALMCAQVRRVVGGT